MYLRGDASYEGERETEEEEREDKHPWVTLDETDNSSNKEEREMTGGEETMDSNDEEQRVGHDGGQGEETENLELEQYAGGDGLAEKGGEESGCDENSVEKRFEKIDMRQIKEKMGDRLNIVVENLVCLPKEDREKVLLQYISMMPENIDEKDKLMAEMAVRWVVDEKLAEEKAAERERIKSRRRRN